MTAKEIAVIRMIVREEVIRNSGVFSMASTVQPDPNMRYQVIPEQTYVVGTYPFQQTMHETQYNEYLAKLSEAE